MATPTPPDPHDTATAGSSETLFDRFGGEAGVRELVDTFYDLMDLEPGYAVVRTLHPSTLDGSRDKLFWYLCGWLGGPQHYVERFGHPRLRARHLPWAIGEAERDAWLACMHEAMARHPTHATDPTLHGQVYEALNALADWMRNKPG